ncbi:MAG: LysM peptidoglycan-binding domain-containing protein [Verrucomicrobiota bacterium]
MIRPVLLSSCALVLFLFTGCDQLFQNHAERELAEAEQKYSSGEYPAAVSLYEAALDGTQKTAEAHYKLALIYDDKLNQPMSAIHHYQRYLDLDAGGSHVKDAQRFLKDARLKVATSSGNGATVTQDEAVRLKNDNLALRKKNMELRADLESASKARAAALKAMGPKAGGLWKQEQVQKPLVDGVRTYTVEPGDTLASISRKFYNSAGRWKDIQDANFNALEGTAKLKIGMTLMIP